MDTDISDILASVSRPAVSPATLDLQALTRAWVNERAAPGLLPYPSELLERVLRGVAKQIQTIEQITGSLDSQANFTLVILQTELERVKFLVRSLVRARMAKIDRYPHHYRTLSLQHQHQNQHQQTPSHLAPPTLTPDQPLPLLSPLESQYLHTHQTLLATHHASSFLSAFPAPLQKLDDTAGGVSMVDAPDEFQAVFVRVLRDAGRVGVLRDYSYGKDDGKDDGEVELKRGDVWVLRWGDVEGAVGRGEVELI